MAATGQLAVDEKYNKIRVVPKLLERLSLEGCIVTADALNCQCAIAATIVEQGASHVLVLKGNNGRLHDHVRRFLSDPQRSPCAARRTVDGGHGRIEPRTSLVRADIAWPQKQLAGPGLTAIGQVVRVREVGTKETTETAPICSARRSALSASAKSPAQIGASKTACIRIPM